MSLDAKSTGDDILYVRPNTIKLIAPEISEQFSEELPVAKVETAVDELNKTYLGKWYRIDIKKAGEELPRLANEIPGMPYGVIPPEPLNTESFMKQQQESEKQIKDHLSKLQAIFDKHTIVKATARDKGWGSYFNPQGITYDASIDQQGLSALLLDTYDWFKDTPIGDGKTAGVTYNMENISEKQKEEFQKFINRVALEFTLS